MQSSVNLNTKDESRVFRGEKLLASVTVRWRSSIGSGNVQRVGPVARVWQVFPARS